MKEEEEEELKEEEEEEEELKEDYGIERHNNEDVLTLSLVSLRSCLACMSTVLISATAAPVLRFATRCAAVCSRDCNTGVGSSRCDIESYLIRLRVDILFVFDPLNNFHDRKEKPICKVYFSYLNIYKRM